MRRLSIALSLATVLLFLTTNPGRAEVKAELVQTRIIWDQGTPYTFTDLVRFKDRWYCVCREGQKAYSPDGVLRIISSADGVKWESLAAINSPTPNTGLHDPKLVVTPKGLLMLTAPKTTTQALTWFSTDGRVWSKPKPAGNRNFILTGVTCHKGLAYTYSYGCICGIAQTIQICASEEQNDFQGHWEQTFSGFLLQKAALVFEGENVHCLMTRTGGLNASQTGYLGSARAPYRDWERVRTSLCWFDPKSGKLQELLELPTRGKAINVGLAVHDGHLWVSDHRRCRRSRAHP